MSILFVKLYNQCWKWEALQYYAGTFYNNNNKPTGPVVSQQPFGDARASGSNDKAGSTQNLLRWVSSRMVHSNPNNKIF